MLPSNGADGQRQYAVVKRAGRIKPPEGLVKLLP